ncbi:MAG: hypothetical protein M3264_04890 [Thermoproteota archaeon]|nr:hypothetical protein [Thermoproteota archaeon]
MALWYVGSSQSKEADDRLEEKIDLLTQRLDSEKGKQLIQELDKKVSSKGVISLATLVSKLL